MTGSSIVLDARFALAEVDRRLFGSFVEHMGRCVYTGIYEPEHPTADASGFRSDVMELVRERTGRPASTSRGERSSPTTWASTS